MGSHTPPPLFPQVARSTRRRGITLTLPSLLCPCRRNAVHKVNKQPVSIKFYG